MALLLAGWASFQNLYRFRTAQWLFDEPTYAGAAWNYVHFAVRDAGEPGGGPEAHNNFEHPPLAKLLFGLAQLAVGRPSVAADRMVAGLCVLATGLVVAVWVGRAAGRWVGLLAAAFVTLLPQTVNEADGRFSRFGMLEPVAALFVVLSLALGWSWWQHRGRSSWLFAVATGIAIGAASSAKENGLLAMAGCTVLLLATASGRRERVTRLVQSATAAVAAAVTLLVLYLPVGHPLMRIQYMLDFQSDHGLRAHGVTFAGRYALNPPWWTHLWFAGHGMGAVLTAVLVVLVVAAVVLRRDALVAWCATALLVPFVVHSFLVAVKLPYYWTMWQAPFLVLAALGAGALVARARAVGAHPLVAAGVALACLIVPVNSALAESRQIARLEPVGLLAFEAVQREHGLRGAVLVGGIYRSEHRGYRGRSRFVAVPTPGALEKIDAVVLSKPRCNIVISAEVRALVEANGERLRKVYSDRRVDVFAVTSQLTMPSAAAVAAQPVLDIAKLC